MQTPAPIDPDAWLRGRSEAELLDLVRRLTDPALRLLLDRYGSTPECDVCPCGDPWCNCTRPIARKIWYLPFDVEVWILWKLFPEDYAEPDTDQERKTA